MPKADAFAVYLSQREFEVIQKIIDGQSYEEIAKALDVDPPAISATLRRCREFYFCKTTAQLMFRIGEAHGRGRPVKRMIGGRPRKRAAQP